MFLVQGLINAVSTLMPRAEHRMCARHIYANWRKKHKDQKYQKRFWRCAKASCRTLFNYNRAKLAQMTPQGARDLMSTNPIHWSRAWFSTGSNCDSVDNNMCESFNAWIIDSRFHPVITMLEGIRRKVMERIQVNRSKCAAWQGTICPNSFKKLKISIKQSGWCHVISNGAGQYEVKEKEKRRYTVDLAKRTCSCGYWQLAGLPCCHAIASMYNSGLQLEGYISKCYCIEEYQKT